MKKLLLFAWLLLPIGAVAFHYGPGQELLARERAKTKIAQATRLLETDDWQQAVDLFGEARAKLSEVKDREGSKLSEAQKRKIRLQQLRLSIEEARTELTGGKVIEAQDKLDGLVAELKTIADETGEKEARTLLVEARSEIARAGYFAAWLMRLEGATAEEWKPEAETARQQFRLLAEEASKAKEDKVARKLAENLEATIRLELMDQTDLEALPLPKDCPCNCSGLSQRKRKQRMAKAKKKGKGKGKKDARKKVQKSQGAGINKRKGSGS